MYVPRIAAEVILTVWVACMRLSVAAQSISQQNAETAIG